MEWSGLESSVVVLCQYMACEVVERAGVVWNRVIKNVLSGVE